MERLECHHRLGPVSGTLNNTNIQSRERKELGKEEKLQEKQKDTRRNLTYVFLPDYGMYIQTQVKKNK